jgi:hypothetical protein
MPRLIYIPSLTSFAILLAMPVLSNIMKLKISELKKIGIKHAAILGFGKKSD